MNEFEVIFYERADGVKPAQEFLISNKFRDFFERAITGLGV